MQNKATWLKTTPEGFKVRVQFTPLNEPEAEKCKEVLVNGGVKIVGVSVQGVMTIDLLFEKPAPPPIVAVPKAADPVTTQPPSIPVSVPANTQPAPVTDGSAKPKSADPKASNAPEPSLSAGSKKETIQ